MASTSNHLDPAAPLAHAATTTTRATTTRAPVFLMSRPRDDWRVRGRANVFAAAVNDAGAVTADAAAAQRDWDAVKDAVVEAGGVVVTVDNGGVDGDPLLTGLPFTAEAGVLGRDEAGPVFVLPQLTPPHRQREPAVVGPAVRGLGLRTCVVSAPFEGQGDVIEVGSAAASAFVCTFGAGPWARTARQAFDEVTPLLPGPFVVVGFHADPWFHGNTFLGSFKKGSDVVTLVCQEALVRQDLDRFLTFVDDTTVVSLTKEQTLTYATNALQVNDTVIAPAGVPDVVVGVWRDLGLTVRCLELPALFRKGGGAAVCLTNRLWGFSVDERTAISSASAGRVR